MPITPHNGFSARIDQLVAEAQELTTGPDNTTQRNLGLLKEVQAPEEVAEAALGARGK